MTFLAERCPRLYRAARQHNEEVRRESAGRLHRASMVLSAERLVAHRDLQLVRAFHTGSAAYIRERQRKLKDAERQLDHARRAA